jgi:hypothetical protein
MGLQESLVLMLRIPVSLPFFFKQVGKLSGLQAMRLEKSITLLDQTVLLSKRTFSSIKLADCIL